MFSALLLSWYDQNKRSFPFRGTRDAYRIWLSEIMLQQTRTETVGAYYQRFLQRFPNVFSLAEAKEQEVLKCWEGLGYYSRARNLHKAAQVIAERYGGEFPADFDLLRALPGVGDYTAAAVASIAFDLPCPAMDGNLTRVLSRFHGIRQDVGIPSVKRQLAALAKEDMPPVRCGDFNQALMDLGATVCVPGTPECHRCPLSPLCDAYRQGDAEDLPVKAAAKPPKEIPVTVLLIACGERIWMRQRQESLLNGLWVYHLTESDRLADAEAAAQRLGMEITLQKRLGTARHVFTHRIWNMTVYHCQARLPQCKEGKFVTAAEMAALPIPTAMHSPRAWAEELLLNRTSKARLMPLSRLHPSQLYISAEKLRQVQTWFDPKNLHAFDPLPTKALPDGTLYLTDGHTRAVAAFMAGLTQVPVCDEEGDWDFEGIERCVQWCDQEGADTVEKLARRVVSESDYQRLWSRRCEALWKQLEEERHAT